MRLVRSGERLRRIEKGRADIDADLLRIEVWTAVLRETPMRSKQFRLRVGLIRRALNRLERA